MSRSPYALRQAESGTAVADVCRQLYRPEGLQLRHRLRIPADAGH